MSLLLPSSFRTNTTMSTYYQLLSLLLFSLLISKSSSTSNYIPVDNHLITCGSHRKVELEDGRIFMPDDRFLTTTEDVRASITHFPSSLPSSYSSDLYLNGRIFPVNASYAFPISQMGRHWVRLYFFPLPHPSHKLTDFVFTVYENSIAFLSDFSVKDNSTFVLKEYLVNILSDTFTLIFSPRKKSFAFINAIEIVSTPEVLIPDLASAVSPAVKFYGLSSYDFEVSYRLNVGGTVITPNNDTLSRTWATDEGFMKFSERAQMVSINPTGVKYPINGATNLVAPHWVYATAESIDESANYNLTWIVSVNPTFSYFVRMHFCDIVSKSQDGVLFNIYINGLLAVKNFDLSMLASGLKIPYYRDFVINASALASGSITVELEPSSSDVSKTAILNGLEVMKMTQSERLDSLFRFNWRTIAVVVAVVLMLLLLIILLFVQWRQRRMVTHLNGALGGYFSLAQLQSATNNFQTEIGEGGFGKVYSGVLKGKRVAIKRGNPRSKQGLMEFKNEIEILSKLRHKHLVSLLGYCNEQTEMILVYEYMAKGSLNQHLYGSSVTPLTWRERLDVCIQAAAGLHYLHTGSVKGHIIHRDVKSSNILLDECNGAKVSDFGISKASLSFDMTHMSTVVKGTSGYLDPQYFETNRLTTKSDVYAFGVVMLEVLCGRPAVDHGPKGEQVALADWVLTALGKGAAIEEIVDPNLHKTVSSNSFETFVEVAVMCLAYDGERRPTMSYIMQQLERSLQNQEQSDKVSLLETPAANEEQSDELPLLETPQSKV